MVNYFRVKVTSKGDVIADLDVRPGCGNAGASWVVGQIEKVLLENVDGNSFQIVIISSKSKIIAEFLASRGVPPIETFYDENMKDLTNRERNELSHLFCWWRLRINRLNLEDLYDFVDTLGGIEKYS